ncbi:MAG: hypothetical protein LBQ02_00155 [Candidatus Nomurabacteria bacterium]|jgi:hypothetical protein|nr:hypothetical protein [Candidatus Nomurabacteria bacterium]
MRGGEFLLGEVRIRYRGEWVKFKDIPFGDWLNNQLDSPILPPDPSDPCRLNLLETEEKEEEETEEERESLYYQRVYDETRSELVKKLQREHGATVWSYRFEADDYLLAVFDVEGYRAGVAEHQYTGHATYLYVEDEEAPGTIEEVLSLTKREARECGAKRLYHVSDVDGHYERIKNRLEVMTG